MSVGISVASKDNGENIKTGTFLLALGLSSAVEVGCLLSQKLADLY
jgi:hypothetical protein